MFGKRSVAVHIAADRSAADIVEEAEAGSGIAAAADLDSAVADSAVESSAVSAGVVHPARDVPAVAEGSPASLPRVAVRRRHSRYRTLSPRPADRVR